MKKQIISTFLIFGFLILSGCDFDNPEFKDFKNFKVEKLTKDKLTFSVDISAFNPNNYKVAVRKSTLKVYLDDYYLGDAHLLGKYKMPKEATTTDKVPIEVELNKGAFLYLLSKISNKDALIKLEGKLKASVAGFPVKKDISQSKRVNLNELGINLGQF